jgi:hypothetical protein
MRYNFKSVARDGAGNIIPSATVSVYLAGTTTAASIYTALAGGTAVNSVTSGTDGSFEFYIDDTDYAGTQRFKITIAKSNYASVTRDYLTIFDINSVLDTDGTLAADSDDLVATQKATKTYADAKVSADAYDVSWSGVNTISPSQNAVYNQIESIVLGSATVSDTAYSSDWNGVTTVSPSKNATYDQLEAMAAVYGALVSDTAYGASWNGVTDAAPSKNAVYDKTELLAPKANPIFTGTVTSSEQPYFFATLASTQSNVTGDNTAYNITGAIWTEVSDIGNCFSNGTFTAPATGRYLLSGQVQLSNANCDSFDVYLITSNRTHTISSISNTLSSTNWGYLKVPFCRIVDMDAADTAYLQVQTNFASPAKYTDVTTGTIFYGYLLP